MPILFIGFNSQDKSKSNWASNGPSNSYNSEILVTDCPFFEDPLEDQIQTINISASGYDTNYQF